MRSASHECQVLLRSLPTTAESAQPRIPTPDPLSRGAREGSGNETSGAEAAVARVRVGCNPGDSCARMPGKFCLCAKMSEWDIREKECTVRNSTSDFRKVFEGFTHIRHNSKYLCLNN